ncbi:MAG: tryptophan 7-halogenase, partial [Verrucomicrobia bacterium]|nr:tryptophan 7-halogenase [Verrucomicrobiota bacterium]
TRLAQLGFSVVLAEAARFPRRHLGESLTPGVRPLLASFGAASALEGPGVLPVRRLRVHWETAPRWREEPEGHGVVVDRGLFDLRLLQQARRQGVRVLQPARVRSRPWNGRDWILTLDSGRGPGAVRCRFVADASGRRSPFSGPRRRMGHPTVALHAYWRGTSLPDEPCMEAGPRAWYWGVPLPDGTYNTLVFADRDGLRPRSGDPATLSARFEALLEESSLLKGCRDRRRLTRVAAVDATAWHSEDCVSPASIRVGDAALALDPLSSSGVQKALQSALSGALVINTLLRRPELQSAALAFHRHAVASASERHRRWTSSHYAEAARWRPDPFWTARTADGPASESSAAAPPPRLPSRQECLVRSAGLEWVELPCLGDQFVELRSAVRHPRLDGPVAFVGGWELAPLVRGLPEVIRAQELVDRVAALAPGPRSGELAHWLVVHQLWVPEPGAGASPPSP